MLRSLRRLCTATAGGPEAVARAVVGRLRDAITNKDGAAYLSAFIPEPFTVCGHTADEGFKTVTLHNGSMFAALTSFTPPAALYAEKMLADLHQRDFSHTLMPLLSYRSPSEEEVLAVVGVERFDSSGAVFQKLGACYSIVRVPEPSEPERAWLVRAVWSWEEPTAPPPELVEELQLDRFQTVAAPAEDEPR